MAKSERVRKIGEAELLAYQEADAREGRAKRAAAHLLGYRLANGNDSPWPYVCPVCAANVSMSSVQQHTDWHASLS